MPVTDNTYARPNGASEFRDIQTSSGTLDGSHLDTEFNDVADGINAALDAANPILFRKEAWLLNGTDAANAGAIVFDKTEYEDGTEDAALLAVGDAFASIKTVRINVNGWATVDWSAAADYSLKLELDAAIRDGANGMLLLRSADDPDTDAVDPVEGTEESIRLRIVGGGVNGPVYTLYCRDAGSHGTLGANAPGGRDPNVQLWRMSLQPQGALEPVEANAPLTVNSSADPDTFAWDVSLHPAAHVTLLDADNPTVMTWTGFADGGRYALLFTDSNEHQVTLPDGWPGSDNPIRLSGNANLLQVAYAANKLFWNLIDETGSVHASGGGDALSWENLPGQLPVEKLPDGVSIFPLYFDGGMITWSNMKPYGKRAVAKDDGVVYVALRPNTNKKPRDNPHDWSPFGGPPGDGDGDGTVSNSLMQEKFEGATAASTDEQRLGTFLIENSANIVYLIRSGSDISFVVGNVLAAARSGSAQRVGGVDFYSNATRHLLAKPTAANAVNVRVWVVEDAAAFMEIAERFLPTVSQPDAEAGTSEERRIWTSKRVAQAIAAFAEGSLERRIDLLERKLADMSPAPASTGWAAPGNTDQGGIVLLDARPTAASVKAGARAVSPASPGGKWLGMWVKVESGETREQTLGSARVRLLSTHALSHVEIPASSLTLLDTDANWYYLGDTQFALGDNDATATFETTGSLAHIGATAFRGLLPGHNVKFTPVGGAFALGTSAGNILTVQQTTDLSDVFLATFKSEPRSLFESVLVPKAELPVSIQHAHANNMNIDLSVAGGRLQGLRSAGVTSSTVQVYSIALE